MTSTEVNARTILRYIDAHLELHGWINTPQVMDVFKIKRQKASALFTKYRELEPANMRYSTNKHRYERSTVFRRAVLDKEDSAFNYMAAIDTVFG